jgi:3',5'-cyclic AMP phosphodiesterase CpdA
MLVLHGSDLQIGRPYRPRAAEAFLSLAEDLAPDVVVVAGDLTQRAKVREYEIARQLLEDLRGLPVVVAPGNHDVPLYRIWERLFSPYRNWRRYVAPELDSVTRVPGGTVVALNSSAPGRAIVSGRIHPAQVRWASGAFEGAAETDARILVIHHHFVATPQRQGGAPLPGAADLLREFEAMGVDIILGGHVHQTHLTTSRALVPGPDPGIPLVACGTTASSRGRGPEAGVNSLNVVRIEDTSIRVTPHRFDPSASTFRPHAARVFPRPGSRTVSSAGSGGSP